MDARFGGGSVLLAEDDPAQLAAIREALREQDLLVIGCRTLGTALEAAEFHRPAVMVVDVAMDGGRGWELLEREAAQAGTLLLALDRTGDGIVRRAAFGAGADDVVSPPIVATEVAARVRSLAKRDRAEPLGPVLRHGEIVIDVPSHEVRIAGRAIAVTAQQFAILKALVEARGATLHRSQLLARIAAVEDEPPSDRAVDLHMSRLRRRLGALGRRYIRSVYGFGYRLISPDPGPELAPDTALAVLDALDAGVLVIDEELRIQAANRRAQRLFEGQAVVGRMCAEVLRCQTPDGVDMSGAMCLGRAALAGGGTIAHVRTLVQADGGHVEVDLSHTAVSRDGAARVVAVEIHGAGR